MATRPGPPKPREVMNAISYKQASEATALRISQVYRPEPASDEILVKVFACGLNFADILARKGLYPDAPPYPFVPGYEIAGEVMELGDNVQGEGCPLKVGDKVFGFTLFGGYAQYAVAKHYALMPLPEAMTFAEGASLPVNLATSYHALFYTGTLLPHDRVLIHAAAGGVGQIAVQMAKAAGCEVFVTASTDAKLKLLSEQFGADHCINYVTSDWAAEIRRICGVGPNGGCLDVILDPVGGGQLKTGLGLVRANGRVVSFGVASLTERSSFMGLLSAIPKVVSMLTFNGIDMLRHSKSFIGLNMLAVAKERPNVMRKAMEASMQLIADGKVRTVISKQYDWRQAGQAQLDMEQRRTTGKIVFMVAHDTDDVDPNFSRPIKAFAPKDDYQTRRASLTSDSNPLAESSSSAASSSAPSTTETELGSVSKPAE